MKILILLPDSPDPWSNTAARYYGPMLKTLAALNEDVTVLALRSGPGNTTDLSYFNGSGLRIRLFDPPAPRPLVERKLRSLWRGGWELALSDFGRATREEAARAYDVLLAEHPSAARLVEDDPRALLSLHCLRYVDLGRGRTKRERPGSLLERIQARRAELSTCRRVPAIRVMTSRLERLLRAERVASPMYVIPACIDLSLYVPQPAPAVPTVGVLGSMFWPPSRRAATQFVERIVPRLRAARPEVRFLVGGWQAQRFLGHLVRDAGVEILDSFPNPAAAFARLSVLVYAPPVGTGMKIKVLEAMAYGVPAVVNAQGFEGLDIDPGPPVRLADSDEEMIAHILQLLDDPAARSEFAERGRRCIQRSFSPQVVTAALLRCLGNHFTNATS